MKHEVALKHDGRARSASPRRVIVVGAGPGGPCAAMLVAARGFRVTVLEKQADIGGRSGAIPLGPYTFDRGSTMLMMRFVVEEMFELAGRRLSDEADVIPLDPMYRLVFGNRQLDVFADPVPRARVARRRVETTARGSRNRVDRGARGRRRCRRSRRDRSHPRPVPPRRLGVRGT